MKRIIYLIVLFSPFFVYAQPGTLDKSFGDTGLVLDKQAQGYLNSINMQRDGKIIAAGVGGYNNNTKPFRLARYNTDGSRDSSFGNNGFAGGNELSQILGVAIQPDDAIIAFGSLISEARIARYKKNGSIDSSFGTNGIVVVNIGKTDVPADIALQPDGRIVLGGYIINADNEARQFFLLRYLPDGSLDKTFADGGMKIVGTANGMKGLATLNAIALQKDGKIVVTTSDDKPYVYRFNEDGSTDTQFGSNGRAFFQNAVDRIVNFAASKIAVQEDGKIVGGGISGTFNMQHSYISAACINADGGIDSGFGKSGLQYTTFEKYESEGTGLLLQTDGKIIITGRTYDRNQTFSYPSLIRLYSDGALDSTFGAYGQTVTEFNGFTVIQGALLQKDNKIVLGGNSFISDSPDGADYFLLARYNNDISRRQMIVTRIKSWLQHHGITWQADNNVRYYTVQKSVDGGITYQPVAKLYNNHQSALTYEEATTNSNALYRVAATAKDGSRSLSNSLLLSNESNVKLFPNPVRSTFQLQGLPTDSKTSITVTDFSGNVRTTITTTGTNASINASSLRPGNYLLKVQSGNTTTTHPFVKE